MNERAMPSVHIHTPLYTTQHSSCYVMIIQVVRWTQNCLCQQRLLCSHLGHWRRGPSFVGRAVTRYTIYTSFSGPQCKSAAPLLCLLLSLSSQGKRQNAHHRRIRWAHTCVGHESTRGSTIDPNAHIACQFDPACPGRHRDVLSGR
jgi:hypothetical protein